MMDTCAEMELMLRHGEQDSYAVDFRFSLPGAPAEIRLGQNQTALACFDLATLNKLAANPQSYGAALTHMLFADPEIKIAFAQALAATQAQSARLRLRLGIAADAGELHSLHWETLQDPLRGSILAARGDIFFSRYLNSQDWRPVETGPRGELRALLVAASPENSARYGLAQIDRSNELRSARAWLGGISSACLPGDGSGQFATLDALIRALHETHADILYLVCHGRILRGEAKLVLEDEQGQAAIINGTVFVERLDRLERRPRLIVLVSCESAGGGNDFGISLAPQLVDHGIPAVIAMQGKIGFETISCLMPVFFRELQRDGQVDRALSIARDAVTGRLDGWMPVLFLRLKNGRIWETSPAETALDGAGIAQLASRAVEALVSSISRQSSLPHQMRNDLLSIIQGACAQKATAREALHEALDDLLSEPTDADAQAALRSQLKKRLAEDPALARHVQVVLQREGATEVTPHITASNRGVAAGRNITGNIFTGNVSGGVNIGGGQGKEEKDCP